MTKPPAVPSLAGRAGGAKSQFHLGVSIYIAPSPSSAVNELTSVPVILVSAPKKGRGRQPEDRAQQPIPLRQSRQSELCWT